MWFCGPPPLPGPPGRYTELQREFSEAVRIGAEQKELILKLEQDLSTVQAMTSLPRPDTEVCPWARGPVHFAQ